MTNFVIIVADDLGYGDVGYHGGTIPTPFIDALAVAGTRLESFYAQPVCTPSRAALMTGKFPYRYGMQSIVWPWNDYGLPDYLPILPQVLQGYDCHMVGKWNLGHSQAAMLPTNRGFKSFFGNYTGSIDYYDHTYFGVHDLHEGDAPAYPTGHLTDLYGRRALDIINAHDTSKPLFLYLAFTAPHLPLMAPMSWYNRFASIPDHARRSYTALVAQMDEWIGDIVGGLVGRGMIDNTLLLFTSDNGGWLGQGGTNGDLKDGKISFYEGGVRVPAFVHYPPWNRGRSILTPMHVADLLPTFLSIAGLPPEPDTDGIDISPALAGVAPAPDRDIIHYVGKNKVGPFGAMRAGDWKLMISPQSNQPVVYNIAADPGENYPMTSPSLVQALLPRFEALSASFVMDPSGIWTDPNGPPADYVFPEVWGPHANFVKMLSVERNAGSWKEALGYPAGWEPK